MHMRTDTTRTVRSGTLAARLAAWIRSPWGDVAPVVLALALSTWIVLAVWHTGDFDVPEYQQYARAFWFGQPRFALFPAEYPPLALLPFSLTLLPGFANPQISFALAMDALFLAGYALMWRDCGRVAARRYAWYLLIGLQATLLDRFDLVPAVIALAALLAARQRRYSMAYALLAVGILLKVYPLVLLPVVAIAQFRTAGPPPLPGADRRFGALLSRVRPALMGAAGCLALVAVGLLLPALRNPGGALAFVTYGLHRPPQVESLAASVLWLGSLFGIPATHAYSFGSDTYIGALGDPVSMALTLALPVGLLAVYLRQLRGKLSLERASLVAVAFVLLASKVFSTQYMTWILPLAAVCGDDTLAWLAICLLTYIDYPGLYPFNHAYVAWEEVSFMADVALRNALLLFVAVRALLGSAERPAPPEREDSVSGRAAAPVAASSRPSISGRA